jgi:hypothetical protein
MNEQDDLPFDTSDPKAVQASVKKAKSREAIIAEGLKSIMGSEPGRKWVHSLLVRTHPGSSPFSSDPYLTAFRAGEQNIGLQLIAELHACSTDLYLIMMKENQDA